MIPSAILYPERNVLAVQETPNVSASVLQDTLKKTDGAVSIVGEVATDDVAARNDKNQFVSKLVPTVASSFIVYGFFTPCCYRKGFVPIRTRIGTGNWRYATRL